MEIGLVLFVVAVVMIPIMLFVKPCCFRGDAAHEDEQDEIEFTNINNRGVAELEQNLVQPGIQRQSKDMDGAGTTDDAMKKR